MDKKSENRFYDLLGIQLSNQATESQKAELRLLLEENVIFQKLYDELVNSQSLDNYDGDFLEQVYASHYISKKFLPELQSSDLENHKLPNKGRILTWRNTLLIAASIIFTLMGTYFFLIPREVLPSLSKNEMSTTKGSKSRLVLPDGSIVFLNVDSRIVYSDNFNKEKRELTLTGEAYFEVAHNALKPFIVNAGGASIKVLGTSFNVRNYPDEDFVETSLIKGRVEVIPKNHKQKTIVLDPLEKLILSKNAGKSKKSDSSPLLMVTHVTKSDSVVVETSWVTNRFVMIDKTLHEITSELEREFNIKVVYKTAVAKNYRYTVNIVDATPAEIMEILSLSKMINYTLTKDNELIIE